MAFQLSPGVNVSEIDLTTVIPAVSTSTGAFAGPFTWGPVNEPTLINSEVSLVRTFGAPTDDNYESFFSAANFLAYSNSLYVVRVADSAATANASGVSGATAHLEAKYPGTLGNSILVQTCPASDADAFEATGSLAGLFVDISADRGKASFDGNTTINAEGRVLTEGDILVLNGYEVEVEDISGSDIIFANKFTGYEDFGDANTSVSSNVTVKSGVSKFIGSAPVDNSIHVVVVDASGEITGEAGTALEVYANLSTVSGAKNADGTTNYWADAINAKSAYIAADAAITLPSTVEYTRLAGGSDGSDESNTTIGTYVGGYDMFKNAEEYDVSLIVTGKANSTLQSYIIDNICETRKDCVAFVSAPLAATSESEVITHRNELPSSSYAVMDTGYKYQYDKYGDTYRWVPLNGDIAGLCARTDQERDPWFSPAGYNRGNVKNVVKLRLNPNKAQRDALYAKGINPVISQAGQGTVLFGDKTLLSQPSAFDRINVRRLFIVLEKAIARASRSTLFEFNDEFTRAQFRNIVEPFLREVQGRRGIYDFKVVCDDTNNTAEVIDQNQFVGDIYIKPARAINFIQLNFVAVRTGVAFEEIVGAV
jgi:phage tail sheath protein FI